MPAPTYPQSADVVDSQPTSCQHYNRLRADALRFGAAPADSITAGELLAGYAGGLRLELLPGNRLRVPATPEAPVCLALDGCLVRATAAVDLPTTATPSGPAGWVYVFAVRSAGSATFTLALNTSAAPWPNSRRIGRCYWDGSALQRGSLVSEPNLALAQDLPLALAGLCQLRLSLVAGSPYPLQDVAGAGTVYITPAGGNCVSLYTGGGWRVYTAAEMAVSLEGLGAAQLADLFLYESGGALCTQLVAWSSGQARAVELARLDGVLVQSGEPARRYLGTLRTTTAGVTEDSHTSRLVFNAANRAPRLLELLDNSAHTYTNPAYRPWNNSTAMRLQFVLGVVEEPVAVQIGLWKSGSGYGQVSVGLDATNAAEIAGAFAQGDPGAARYLWSQEALDPPPAPGYHFLQAIEYGNATSASYQGMALRAHLWS